VGSNPTFVVALDRRRWASLTGTSKRGRKIAAKQVRILPDLLINIYNYQDSVLIFSSSSGNLCVYGYDSDRDRSANTYVAPIGWNLGPINNNEE
jgi:hypothetical protein